MNQETFELIAVYYPIESGIPFPDDFKRELRFEVPAQELDFFTNLVELSAN